MYIVSLTYTAPLAQIDDLLEEHIAYLNTMYEQGVFLASGRKIPRTGGIILATAPNEEALLRSLAQDPFYANDVASYTITEFMPTMAQKNLEALLGQ